MDNLDTFYECAMKNLDREISNSSGDENEFYRFCLEFTKSYITKTYDVVKSRNNTENKSMIGASFFIEKDTNGHVFDSINDLKSYVQLLLSENMVIEFDEISIVYDSEFDNNDNKRRIGYICANGYNSIKDKEGFKKFFGHEDNAQSCLGICTFITQEDENERTQ